MLDTIFREYDIRGKVGSEFRIDQAYALTKSIIFYFLQQNPSMKTVLVGMDARSHSEAIKNEVVSAITDSGCDAVFIGVCPTPVLYFGLYTMPVDAGIMITASHNPPEYNGIKLCLGKHSVWGLSVKEIRELYKKGASVVSLIKGSYRDYPLIADYVAWTADHFKHLKNRELNIVMDCGNGTAALVLPLLIEAMQWKNVELLCDSTDGSVQTHEADPVKEKNMLDVRQHLQSSTALIGIGFDGDVDRMAAMTKQGYLVKGDQLLGLFSKDIAQIHPGVTVVMDIKSSSGLLEFLASHNAKPCMAPSGHAIIKDYMRKNNALLGGELSCHFFFADRYFGYDDGIYAACRLIELLIKSGKTLDQLVDLLPKKQSTSEFRIPCQEENKQTVVSSVFQQFSHRSDVTLITIDGVRASTNYGWGIVRASNTQPELCLRFESESAQGLSSIREDFLTILNKHYDRSLLDQWCPLS